MIKNKSYIYKVYVFFLKIPYKLSLPRKYIILFLIYYHNNNIFKSLHAVSGLLRNSMETNKDTNYTNTVPNVLFLGNSLQKVKMVYK